MDDDDKLYAELLEDLRSVDDITLLALIEASPVLPDETEENWWHDDTDKNWELAYQFLAFAEVAAERRLVDAIEPLLERVCYGDPGEMMRTLRHSLEAIVKPHYSILTHICIKLVMSPNKGARFWSINELGILCDIEGVPALLSGLDDPVPNIVVEAVSSLFWLCKQHHEIREQIVLSVEDLLNERKFSEEHVLLIEHDLQKMKELP